jgi:protein-disulfide isomerase
MHSNLFVTAGIAVALLLPSCQTNPANRDEAPASPIVASVNDQPITLDELDAFIKDQLFSQQTAGGEPSRTFQVRSDALEKLVKRRAVEALAAERGVDVDALVESEAEAIGPITNTDVVHFYNENRALLRGATLAQATPSIRKHLEQQRANAAVEAIRKRTPITIALEAPRVDVAPDGPSLGPEDAPVTIIEFGDFQCPFCQRASPQLRALTERYPTEVRLVYRHLPLESIHPRARAAAEASTCADEQGLFWKYHDLLFENQQALSDKDLKGYAAQVGADPARFAACVESRKYAAKIDADVAAAHAISVTGTPAFVINGIVAFGLQTDDGLDQMIRAELADAS